MGWFYLADRIVFPTEVKSGQLCLVKCWLFKLTKNLVP